MVFSPGKCGGFGPVEEEIGIAAALSRPAKGEKLRW
jgi:hypothetical protein